MTIGLWPYELAARLEIISETMQWKEAREIFQYR